MDINNSPIQLPINPNLILTLIVMSIERTPTSPVPIPRRVDSMSHRSTPRRLSMLQALNTFSSSSSIEFESAATLAAIERQELRKCASYSQTTIIPELVSSHGPSTSTTTLVTETTQQPTPLPKGILLILAIVILSEPISLTILFPFVYFMVRSFGFSNEKEIGYYVGFIASAFSLAQFMTSIFWGWLSDRVGRRPILLIGLLGNTLTILAFGMSHSLGWAIASRAACGILNGNIGVAKCVMGEITDKTNQAFGFSFIGLVWGIGMILGPILGGFLSDPARNFPSVFGQWDFFIENPYFLPCFVSAVISFAGFLIGFFYLQETLKRRLVGKTQYHAVPCDEEPSIDHVQVITQEQNQRNDSEITLDVSSSTPALDACREASETGLKCKPLDIPSQTKYLEWPSIAAIMGYALISFFNIIFDETFALWMIGGLGYGSNEIGMVLSLMGVVTLTSQLWFFPYFHGLMNSLTIYRMTLPVFVVLFLFFPILSNVIAISQEWNRFTWGLLLLSMSVRHVGNTFVFTAIMIMINNSATREQLGIVNGVGQTSAAFVRGIGPALGGIIWSWSLTNHQPYPFNQYFVFQVLSCIALVAWLHSFIIPDSVRHIKDDMEDENEPVMMH